MCWSLNSPALYMTVTSFWPAFSCGGAGVGVTAGFAGAVGSAAAGLAGAAVFVGAGWAPQAARAAPAALRPSIDRTLRRLIRTDMSRLLPRIGATCVRSAPPRRKLAADRRGHVWPVRRSGRYPIGGETEGEHGGDRTDADRPR